MLARGTCIDSVACTGSTTCGAWGGTGQSADAAWKGQYFSSAIAAFTSGAHTVLLRVNNPNGCGYDAKASCVGSGNIRFKLETGK